MAKIAWYKRDPEAALTGMMCLTLEERGAYNTVLDLIYSGGGSVVDDDRFLAGWMRCDVRIWKRIRGRLIDLKKVYSEGGVLRNSVADRVVHEALLRGVSAREAGLASASKRQQQLLNNNDIDSTDVERNPQLYKKKNKNSVERDKSLSPSYYVGFEKKSDEKILSEEEEKTEREETEIFSRKFEEFWRTYPKNNGHKKRARAKYETILKSGVPHETIIDGARRYAHYIDCSYAGDDRIRFTQHAATWLNGAGWEGEWTPLSPTSRAAGGCAPSPHDKLGNAWAEALREHSEQSQTGLARLPGQEPDSDVGG